jgi:hypothetical protein
MLTQAAGPISHTLTLKVASPHPKARLHEKACTSFLKKHKCRPFPKSSTSHYSVSKATSIIRPIDTTIVYDLDTVPVGLQYKMSSVINYKYYGKPYMIKFEEFSSVRNVYRTAI